jgi:hypothetical protein
MNIASAFARLAVVFAVASGLSAPASGAAAASDRTPDHVLVWTRDIDKVTAVAAVKLGFQVRPGGEFDDGVANRLVRFANGTYLELLYFARPPGELRGDARDDYAATARGTVANGVGIQVGDVDTTARLLRDNGWKLEPETPMTYDPDGDGPLPAQESMWRTVEFSDPPLTAADIFFIHYKDAQRTPSQIADNAVFRTHPNGAVGISSVWLLSADPEADAARLLRLGFDRRQPVELAAQGLSGLQLACGEGSILVLKPSAPGPAADALAARGPHLYGVGVEVADLRRAQRVVERGYGQNIALYKGVAGDAFMAPTYGELGFVVEFHASSSAKNIGGK